MDAPQYYTESLSEMINAKTEVEKIKEDEQNSWFSEFMLWFWYIIGGLFFGLMLMSSKGLMMWT